jgi:hypothetical protein
LLLRQEKYSGRYDVLWRFVAGLLHDHGEGQLCIFLEEMQCHSQDLLGPAHQRLFMHCLSEVPLLGPFEGNNTSLQKYRGRMELGCLQWSLYEHNFLEEMHLCGETEFPEHLVSKMLKGESSQLLGFTPKS